jgi:hypothetical protein
MSTAPVASTAKSSAPPAPVPPEAPPAAPRPLRPAAPSQLQLSEFAVRHHTFTLTNAQEFDDCLRPEFWAGIANRLRVCDKIDVFSARNDIYVELMVRQVTLPDGVRGSRGGAWVHVLRRVDLEPVERRPRPVEHRVEFQGPSALWCVVRNKDDALVAHHLDTREAAEQHLARMATAAV